jgi:hypothetical protein
MKTIGVLLLTAATATGGIGKPHTGKIFLRHHAVTHGAPPAGGPIDFGAAGCQLGHPGCQGGGGCPGPGGGGPGGGGWPGGAPGGRRFPNVRSQVYFVEPAGLKVGWQTTGGGVERVYLPGQLTVPARYNFLQGYIYRLKLTDIPGRTGLQLYPTIEVAPSTPATDAYLTHNPIPVQFTEEDFDQVQAGNFVTKVIYLPDPKFQELAIAGVETLVSTRLEPGIDPILEADRRGTILMIVRLGAIDLEMPNVATGVLGDVPTTVVPGSAPGTVLPPGSLPPGVSGPFAPGSLPPGVSAPYAPYETASPPPMSQSVPVDNAAPVAPAPSSPTETTPPAMPAVPPAATPPPEDMAPPPAEAAPPAAEPPAEAAPPAAEPPAEAAPPAAEPPAEAPQG